MCDEQWGSGAATARVYFPFLMEDEAKIKYLIIPPPWAFVGQRANNWLLRKQSEILAWPTSSVVCSSSPALPCFKDPVYPGLFYKQRCKWLSHLLMFLLQNISNASARLAKCHHPHHPGWFKIFSGWVKIVTEHTAFCRKLNFLSQFFIFLGVRVLRNVGNISFRIFCSEIISYFHCIFMTWSLFTVFLLLFMLCCKFVTAKITDYFG